MLKRLRQEDCHKFSNSLEHISRSCLKVNQIERQMSEAGKMAQWLNLSEGLGCIRSTHKVPHDCLKLQIQRPSSLFHQPWALNTCGARIYTQAKRSHNVKQQQNQISVQLFLRKWVFGAFVCALKFLDSRAMYQRVKPTGIFVSLLLFPPM